MTLYGYPRDPDSPDEQSKADATETSAETHTDPSGVAPYFDLSDGPTADESGWAVPQPPVWAGPEPATWGGSEPATWGGSEPATWGGSEPATWAGTEPAAGTPTAPGPQAPTAPAPLAPTAPGHRAPGEPAPGAAAEPWDVHREVTRSASRRGPFAIGAAGMAVILAVTLAAVVGGALGDSGDLQASWRGGGVQSAAVPSPTATPAPAGDTITLSGVGDVIMGTAPGDLPPRGGAGFFDPVKNALSSDLVMGNLETPLTEDTGNVKCGYETPPATPGNPSPTPTKASGCHQFYLPPSYANHLRDGGFDLLSLANNHTHDMGPAGLRNTRAALDAAGIKFTGAPGQITNVDIKGVKVAVLGFAIYSWGQNLNNIPAAAALVRKADEEADVVVIQMQGGAEGSSKSHQRPGHEFFLGEDRGDLMTFSRAVIDAGADVIFGHGPHIMRGMEFYKDRLIAYSLGNFCGYGVLQSSGFLGVGGVLKVTLRKDGSWAGGQLVATEMVKGGLVAPDPDKRALSFVNRLSREDFGANAARISGNGTITPPSAA